MSIMCVCLCVHVIVCITQFNHLITFFPKHTHTHKRKQTKPQANLSSFLSFFLLPTGGPGSGKGRIVTNLKSMFGMKLITIEETVLKYLPKKMQHTMTLENSMVGPEKKKKIHWKGVSLLWTPLRQENVSP